MSSSIAIPKRRLKRPAHHQQPRHQHAMDPSSPSSSPSSLSSPSSSSSSSPGFGQSSSPRGAAAGGSVVASPSSSYGGAGGAGVGAHYRRPSLLSESMGRGEYTVVDVGSGENMRLITCVRASQGFEWNQEMFLPSYANGYGASSDLEHRADPIEDIVLTDEEIASLLPS